jgi:hypothetical protein
LLRGLLRARGGRCDAGKRDGKAEEVAHRVRLRIEGVVTVSQPSRCRDARARSTQRFMAMGGPRATGEGAIADRRVARWSRFRSPWLASMSPALCIGEHLYPPKRFCLRG